MSYSVRKSSDALGITHEFYGPGMPQYAKDVHFMQPVNEWAIKCMKEDDEGSGLRTSRWDHEADRIVRLLASAFEAGRADMRREFRWLLEV